MTVMVSAHKLSASSFVKILVPSIISALIGGVIGATYWLGSLDRDWQEWRIAISNVNRISDDFYFMDKRIESIEKKGDVINQYMIEHNKRIKFIESKLNDKT